MSGGRGERCMVVGVGNIGKVICSALLRASKFVLGWAFFFYLLPGAVVAIAFQITLCVCTNSSPGNLASLFAISWS